MVKVDLVIARYNENLSWLHTMLLFSNPFHKIYVYNKGEAFETFDVVNFSKDPSISIERLPNVGKCDHTFLHHIVARYDAIAVDVAVDNHVTIFLPASCDMGGKLNRMLRTIKDSFENKMSVFYCDKSVLVPADIADFSLDSYISTHAENVAKNPESELQLCNERPYSVWFEKNFGDLCVNGTTYNGIFAVSREHIHHQSREFYEGLLGYVDHSSNPEAGHYIERSWMAIFHPIPEACKFSYTM